MASLVALMSKRFVLSEIYIVIGKQFPYHAARRQINLMDTVMNSRLNKSSKIGEVSEWLPQASEAGDKGEHAKRATQPQPTALKKGDELTPKQEFKKR